MASPAADAKLLWGTFSDAARARGAVGELIGAGARSVDLDFAFYGAGGEYLVLVAAENDGAGHWAESVLREHGAALEERFVRSLAEAGNTVVRGTQSASPPTGAGAADRVLLLLYLALERRLLKPGDLLGLALAYGTAVKRGTAVGASEPGPLPPTERHRRLRKADAELRDVSRRLEEALRAEHPDLFGPGGRLRTKILARRVAEQTGGKRTLSGDELFALEEAADASSARPADAT